MEVLTEYRLRSLQRRRMRRGRWGRNKRVGSDKSDLLWCDVFGRLPCWKESDRRRLCPHQRRRELARQLRRGVSLVLRLQRKHQYSQGAGVLCEYIMTSYENDFLPSSPSFCDCNACSRACGQSDGGCMVAELTARVSIRRQHRPPPTTSTRTRPPPPHSPQPHSVYGNLPRVARALREGRKARIVAPVQEPSGKSRLDRARAL